LVAPGIEILSILLSEFKEDSFLQEKIRNCKNANEKITTVDLSILLISNRIIKGRIKPAFF